MEELRDLNQMAELAIARFSVYDGLDIELPQLFKDNVREIHSSSIKYNRYSAVIETKGYQNGTLNIYMPNQWFFIASYFTDLYNEMMKYKKYALQITTKERLKVLNGGTLTTEESDSLQSMDLSSTSKDYLSRFITDYSWWGGAKTIDRGDFYVSPILSHAKLVNASQSYVADLCAFLSDKQDLVGAILNSEESITSKSHPNCSNNILQRIFYGAPGTGKSNTIKREVEDKGRAHFRTTFHPDSDYSTFVGCYKPTMVEAPVRDGSGHEVANAKPEEKNRISYSFVPQAFAKAYCEAWNKYDGSENAEPVFLIIEEINRGNCAQIFGDIFQLLDREMEGARCGFSTYPIDADEDLKAFLEDGVKRDGTPWLTNKEGIKDGKLCLPPNLYIWATMNTSDQSLFPIDSAFKRRWNWKYVKIKDGKKNWKIDIKLDDENVDWWAFIQKINAIIASMTSSADKQLGYFFCKADKDGVISAETFVSKVIFYLWNDVFKDYGFEDASLFRYKVKEGEKEVEKDLTFPDFYDEDGETVNAERLADFIRKVMNWQNREGNI